MNFTFNDEQEMLKSSAREFLASRYPPERVAEIADGAGFDPTNWSEVAELGWTGISLPEDAGGAGMTFLEEMVVIEELGRALYPGPFLSTVVLALPALAASPDLLEMVVAGKSSVTLAWAGADGSFPVSGLATKATADGDAWRLSGATLFVPDLALAEQVVVVAEAPDGPGLWLVPRDGEGVTWQDLPTVDTTRRLGALSLDAAPARMLVDPSKGPEVLGSIRDRALAALALEAVGVADRALELAVEHAKTRRQFDRPIGVFQAVSHKLADAYVEVENARSLAYYAGWAVANGADEASMAAAGAKGYAAEAAIDVCEKAIQAHGGIGFTWEHPLHRYYKRALWIAAFMGWPSEQRGRVAAALVG
ncbi:MAG: acyl-CoA dehydrogenase family protein [Actinomycetota bacterium]